MVFTTAAQTLAHPAYPSAVWNLTPHSHGRCAAAVGRGGPVNIYWEIHGEGPIKVVLVPGLASTHIAWQRQIRYFGHDLSSQMSVLCFDNRGLGRSDKPLGRYTTSQMALDVIDLLNHVGWTDPRSVHVVGISMGGMISQELGVRVPERLASLALVSTAPAAENLGAWHEMIGKRIAMLMPKTMENSIEYTARQLFSQEWLNAPDGEDVPSPETTPKCAPSNAPDGKYTKFETNFQRFQALELNKRRDPETWSTLGFMAQLMAGASHKKTAAELRDMAVAIGPERVAVVHGTEDEMFEVGLARKLIDAMGPGETQIIDGMGHAPVYENVDWFNSWLEQWVNKAASLDS